MDNSVTVVEAGTKVGATASLVTYGLTNLPLSELAALVGLIYGLMQVCYLSIKFYRNITGKGQW